MQKIIPERLQKGDKIMVIAPARGVKIIGKDVREIARERLESLGLEVVFAPNAVGSKTGIIWAQVPLKNASPIFILHLPTKV